MSQEPQERLTQALCKLGMSNNQAKVYAALVSLGPSGVAEIQRASEVPRTKIYEILEQLVGLGAVEFQSGRPVVYNALSPSAQVDRMRNSYLSAADEATKLLAEMRQVGKNSDEDLAWTVRGGMAVCRKAVSTMASAEKNILIVEQYPPEIIPAASSVIKSLLQRGVKVQAFCILDEEQFVDERLKGEDFIEFRRTSNRLLTGDLDTPYAELRRPLLSIISREACLIIVDDIEAFVSFPDRSDDSRSLGLALKVPGLPQMQRILFEKIVHQATTGTK